MNPERATRVLLTRSAQDNADWARSLRERGYEPVECACLHEVRLPVEQELARELEDADWLACSSRRAVEALHDFQPRLPAKLRLAAVGPATAKKLREHYGRCDAESEQGHSADLGAELYRLGARHTLVVAARGGLHDIEAALLSAGRIATRVELYETQAVEGPLPTEALYVDAAFFTSPSAVRAYLARGPLPATCAAISLGPTTSAALREAGIVVQAESRTRDLLGMITALEQLSKSQR